MMVYADTKKYITDLDIQVPLQNLKVSLSPCLFVVVFMLIDQATSLHPFIIIRERTASPKPSSETTNDLGGGNGLDD